MFHSGLDHTSAVILTAPSFEPDIQAYLENVSRSRYGTREFVGFTNVDDDDHYVGIEDGPYVPDTAAMARGMAILRDLAQTNNGLFFSKDEIADVIENGMAKYPHFPWMNSMSRDALDQQHTLGMDQYDRPMIGWPKDFIVFVSERSRHERWFSASIRSSSLRF